MRFGERSGGFRAPAREEEVEGSSQSSQDVLLKGDGTEQESRKGPLLPDGLLCPRPDYPTVLSISEFSNHVF